ncbi:MAG: class I SAM-dependent methyltransferase [Planctomycetota bacterium]|nr:class I SAM-dependent methyltransferase [Planctomycetota bacterium]
MRSGYQAATPEQTVSDARGESTPCPVCGSTMTVSFQDDEAVYKLCSNCSYLKPCLLDLDAYAVNVKIYSERYDEQLKTAAVVTDKARRKFGRFLDRIAPYHQLGRMIDIGCGAGRMLACAADRGWHAVGADPSMQNLSEDCPDGVEIHPRLLHECEFPDGHFDVVHANEVMEHVDDIIPLLTEMRRVLRPGGLIVLRTPNHRSWTARAVGARWRHYGVAEIGHVGFFTPQTFRKLFEAQRIDLLAIQTHHFSLRDRWSDETPVIGGLCRVVYKLIGLLATATGQGERLMVWGRKPT